MTYESHHIQQQYKDAMYNIQESTKVLLPVGFYDTATKQYTREVEVAEWTGYTQEALTSPIAKNNYNIGISNVLNIVVQSIGENGSVFRKSNPNTMLPDRFMRQLTNADREVILLQSLAISGEEMRKRVCTDKCDHCNAEISYDFDLTEVEVEEWDHAKPPWVEFDLPKQITVGSGNLKLTSGHAKLKLMTGLDAEVLGKKSDKGEFAMLFEMLAQCTEFEGIGKISVDVLKLQPRSFLDFLKRQANIQVGAIPYKKFQCHHCGEETEAKLDLARFLV